MKTTFASRNTHDIPKAFNPHVSQACARELHRFDYQTEMNLIGAELRRLRLEKGLSIESVAKAVGIRKYRLCQIEHGMYIHVNLQHLYILSTHYGASPSEILAVIPGARFENIKYTP